MSTKIKGRRGKYHDWITDEGLLKIEGWARDGLIDKQIAANIGVTERTLTRWKTRFPSIMSALKKGKEVVDREVENALLKRALGYELKETTREPVKDPETGEKKLVITKVVTKEIQPDVTAQIFWLKNRKPNEWRDKRETEISGKDGGPIVTKSEGGLDLSKLSYEELKALEEIYEKATETPGK